MEVADHHTYLITNNGLISIDEVNQMSKYATNLRTKQTQLKSDGLVPEINCPGSVPRMADDFILGYISKYQIYSYTG